VNSKSYFCFWIFFVKKSFNKKLICILLYMLGSRYTDSPYNETLKSLTRYTDWYLSDWPGYMDLLFLSVHITRSKRLDWPSSTRIWDPTEWVYLLLLLIILIWAFKQRSGNFKDLLKGSQVITIYTKLDWFLFKEPRYTDWDFFSSPHNEVDLVIRSPCKETSVYSKF